MAAVVSVGGVSTRGLVRLAPVWKCVSRGASSSFPIAPPGEYPPTNHPPTYYVDPNTSAPTSSKLPALKHTHPQSYEKVEMSTAEWSYVERLIPPTAIPKPTVNPGEVTPSGWVAPSARPRDYPYFVPRAASHMLPVYLLHQPILSRFITSVKHVEGDIFVLAEELREHLTPLIAPKILCLRVHEPHQMIQVKGQLVGEIKEFLLKKGF